MAKKTLNIGSTSNDGQGDTLREASSKINENFTELFSDAFDNAGVSTLDAVKAELASSTDFADFKSRVAAL